jgi:hypothetical protein
MDDGRMRCDGPADGDETEKPCPDSGGWECSESICRSISLVCRNEVGRCQIDDAGHLCECWDGEFSEEGELAQDGAPDLESAEAAELSMQCEGLLTTTCGTTRPSWPADCVGETKDSCEHFGELSRSMVDYCPEVENGGGSWPIYAAFDCCRFREDPENANGFKCLDQLAVPASCETLIDDIFACIEKFPGGVYPGGADDDDDDNDDDDDDDDDDSSNGETDANSDDDASSSADHDDESSVSEGVDDSSTASDASNADVDDESMQHEEPAKSTTCALGRGEGNFGVGILSFLFVCGRMRLQYKRARCGRGRYTCVSR